MKLYTMWQLPCLDPMIAFYRMELKGDLRSATVCGRGIPVYLKALQVQQEDSWQAAQHVVDPVPHGVAAAALARLHHLFVLQALKN